jgi:hypothetical protein
VGATSADTQREIEQIRKDVSSAVAELRSRTRRLSATRPDSRQLRENPAVLAAVALPVIGLGVFAAARAVAEARRRRRPEQRLKRTLWSVAEELGERWERAREALPLEVRFPAGEDGDDRGRSVQVKRSEPSMVKRILWTALVAAMVAGGGLLARRLSAAVWRAAMGEEPPTASV